MGCPWLGGGSGSCLVAPCRGHSSQPIAGTASLSAPLAGGRRPFPAPAALGCFPPHPDPPGAAQTSVSSWFILRDSALWGACFLLQARMTGLLLVLLLVGEPV